MKAARLLLHFLVGGGGGGDSEKRKKNAPEDMPEIHSENFDPLRPSKRNFPADKFYRKEEKEDI